MEAEADEVELLMEHVVEEKENDELLFLLVLIYLEQIPPLNLVFWISLFLKISS